MAGTRKKYTEEFKKDAVRLLNQGTKGGHAIEKDLGIGSGLIYKWRQELEAHGEKRAFPGNGKPRDEEIVRLQKELADVKMERDILKKAQVIFGKETRR